ncbi:MAG: hypothetical protein U1A07_18800, partial [Phenylobacterium sp.]|nr:hypothetical protein [Phenylobacterium sp.]
TKARDPAFALALAPALTLTFTLTVVFEFQPPFPPPHDPPPQEGGGGGGSQHGGGGGSHAGWPQLWAVAAPATPNMAPPAARPSIQFLIRCRIGGTPERILTSPGQTSGRSNLNQDDKSLSFPLRWESLRGWRNAASVC